MPDINVIFDHLGLGITQIVINNDKTFSDLVTKYCKTKCLSKRLMPKLRYLFNNVEIPSSSQEKIEKLSIRNSSVIVVKNEDENNMERGRDDWRDGIIQEEHFSFVSREDKDFIFKALKEKVSKQIKYKGLKMRK